MLRHKKGVFLLLLFLGLLFIASQAYAEGDLTGYFYDPRVGKVAPKVDTLNANDSAEYVAGNIPEPAPALAEEIVGEQASDDAKDKDKDKGNNGVGWGVGGNPEEKMQSDGTYKKNAGKK